jgi:glycosyltransferase involved in cell wall biosynthesis
MKIIEVCPHYHPSIGGIPTHVKELSERLSKNGFDVEIYTTDPTSLLPKEEEINDIPVKRFKSFAPKGSYYFSFQLFKGLRKAEYDVIHSHGYHSFPLLTSNFARKKEKKFFVTTHYCNGGFTFFRSILHFPYEFFGRKIVKNADKIICVTKYEFELLEKKFPFSTKKLLLIPNGVDYGKFVNPKPICKENNFNILYTGRISVEKDLKTLFFAYKEVQERVDNIKLTIVGEGHDLINLKKLEKKLNLKEVIWIGKVSQDEISKYYKSSNLFILPSEKEVFGISLLEAMASGLPIITTERGGIADVVKNNINGLTFNKGDYHQLAQAMLRLIENKTLCNKLAKNSQKLVEKNFDWKILIHKYIQLFNGDD